MKKKVVWLVVSCLMALSLVMASCGPAEEGEEEEVEVGEEEVVITGEEEEEEEVEEEEAPAGPKYGGVITIVQPGDPDFDEVIGMHARAYTNHLTSEELLTGDWTKGPAGTGEATWTMTTLMKLDLMTGSLAESWEIPEVGNMILHIRKGVHYALNPDSEASRLVNGRELTSNDIVTTLNKMITDPRCAMARSAARFAEVTAPDKWTVIIDMPAETFAEVLKIADYASIFAPEVWEKYGDSTDWKNSAGTGPFMLTDYIPSSSAALVRNPNYWDTDPVGPGKGNQLPYMDGVKFLIIPDASSRMAALRTAKIDFYSGIMWEDAEVFMKDNPELMSKEYFPDSAPNVGMRIDKPELPFKDKNVRRALMMATDFETIDNEYYGGHAQIVTWPILYYIEYKGAYLPLEEASESVQELYVYNPEKAQQLLTDAGYPDGFKSTIVCSNTPTIIDYLSIIKDMWAKVNIELVIEPLESGPWSSVWRNRGYEELIYGAPDPIGNIYLCNFFAGNMLGNSSYIDDPLAWEAKEEVGKYAITDSSEADRIFREFLKYALDQAWVVPGVVPPQYLIWWPWLKNYHGEISIGHFNFPNFAKYTWIDQDLKKSMGY